jgi:hypothetical protein
VEQSFRLPVVSGEELRRLLPKVEVHGQEIRVSGRAPAHLLWLYDGNGAFVAARRVQGGRQTLEELATAYPALCAAGGRFRFKVYGTTEMGGQGAIGAVSGPFTAE